MPTDPTKNLSPKQIETLKKFKSVKAWEPVLCRSDYRSAKHLASLKILKESLFGTFILNEEYRTFVENL